ncbi:MAG: hypothetical protein KME17_06775 [Cyanosarcina radialis HA8281-LM2]|jgi:hypothetical protein|nr:hypothetical protein [Cyanosarcina radialis HA8281-LM2]
MWESCIEKLDGDRIQQVSISADGEQISYAEAIDLWQHSEAFRTFFNSLLADAPFPAFFWETPAVTELTVKQPFEFVLVDSPQLAKVRPDSSAFASHFAAAKDDEAVVTFPNLRQDALLVVPCPQSRGSAYPHLAAFVREAPASQQHTLWQTVASTVQQRLHQQPLWLSTSGLGVYWLHVRLDSYPKYYSFQPYRVLG